jgi:hypothetical protein
LFPISATSVVDTDTSSTGGKFTTGVVDTGVKLATSDVDINGTPWLANIATNF